MPGLGRLGSNSAGSQVYNTSGIATPADTLPEKFETTNQPTSPIAGGLEFPADFSWNNAPIVHRAPRVNGMRTLYSRGTQRMPVPRLGADGPPYPVNSRANLNFMGTIRNGHFNDALFQAGWPGYNLGLSFKVPVLEKQTNAGMPATYSPINIALSKAVNAFARPAGTPKRRQTENNDNG